MISLRLILLCFLISACALLKGQGIIHAEYKNLDEVKANIKRLEGQQSQLLKQLRIKISQSDLSTNVQFFLRSAIDQLANYRESQLPKQLERIKQNRPFETADEEWLLEREAAFLFLEKERSALLTLSEQISEDSKQKEDLSPELEKEIKFYHLQDHQRIGELGAGDYSFALAMKVQFPDKQYFINDIDRPVVKGLANTFGLHPSFQKKRTNTLAVLGTSTSTSLEQKALDAIIVRNALHHFTELDAMLNSIKASLNKKGHLYIKESFIGECIHDCCPDLRYREDLLQTIESNGFQLKNALLIEEDGNPWQLWEFALGEI